MYKYFYKYAMAPSFKRWMSRRKEVKMIRFVLFLVLCTICSAEDLPAFVKKCKYGDVECIVKSANDIVANHHHEMDKLKFKYFDPLQHGEVIAGEEEERRPIHLKMHLTNSQVYGIKGMVFNRAVGWEKDIKGRTFEIYGNNNYLNFTGNYEADGSILLLPIQGKGDYNIFVEDITYGFKLKVDEFHKNGRKHLKIKKLKLLLDPSKFHMSLTNLFGGNEELGKSLIDVINNNWRDAWDEVAPSLFDIIEDLIKELLNHFFEGFAYQDMFLPEE